MVIAVAVYACGNIFFEADLKQRSDTSDTHVPPLTITALIHRGIVS